MSKIGMYDNLYLGHSTFIAEMNELHHIFRKAVQNRSLILCDELTAGTEMLSAVGIVASTICHFRSIGVSHIITTHLHALAKLPEVKTEDIHLCHFEVKTEKSSSILISDIKIRYDRQLKEGPGPHTYGIEIADDMGLPKEFIAMAHEIRKKVSYDIRTTRTKKSRYNKKLWMTECFRCGGKQNLHTHHITPQAMFTDGSLENKDGLYNLIVVCEDCHQAIHS
jgi:DNA mismatch repair ATPase MutS